ncbi:hypothetical protein [Microcella sp.]|uniref:hypothetical protein n=1 Tax=Microcella sp. TaxID=1913979 RepID=UPI003F6E7A12
MTDTEQTALIADHGACPVCGRPMAEHSIERTRGSAVLHCPIAHEKPRPDLRPLDELGMPRRDR